MKNFEEMSNNELYSEIKNIEIEYNNLKFSILKDLDNLDNLEKDFKNINLILVNRIKGQKNE